MSKSSNEDQATKQPSLFGISLNETNSESNKTAKLFGISTAPIESSNSTPYYLTPAINQSLNLLELTLQKTSFEKLDFDVLKSTLNLLPLSEISRLRPTISIASLDNLAKKAEVYEKTQTLQNSDATSTNQNQINESQKLMSQEEINKFMVGFLNEKNDLNKNLEERNNQTNLEEKNNQLNQQIKK
jgi:hypothetical protein